MLLQLTVKTLTVIFEVVMVIRCMNSKNEGVNFEASYRDGRCYFEAGTNSRPLYADLQALFQLLS